MPEGPDLHLASRFIQTVCQGRYFSGKVKKSEISKCPPVNWDAELYSITATARGKEIKLTLTEILQGQKNKDKPLTKSKLSGIKSEVKTLDILFRFGLAGRFRFDPVDDIQKHAHLNFYTKDGKMVLSYVDYMRFGTWEPNGQWGAHRGPCVLMEYDQFRKNVVENLEKVAFNKPICEVLLNQRYFNGIGNYLRAEVLYRCGVRPFEQARKVLEPLAEENRSKSKTPDILQLCHILPSEVVALSTSNLVEYDGGASDVKDSAFSKWLKCYSKPNMNRTSDHNRRMVWHAGDAGPLTPKDIPKDKKVSRKKTPKKTTVEKNKRNSDIPDEDVSMEQDKKLTKPRKRKPQEKTKTVKRKSQGKSEHDQNIKKEIKLPKKRVISKRDMMENDEASVTKRVRTRRK